MKNNKKDNLDEFLNIKNQTETTADLYFYGDIVSSWWGAWEDEDQYPDKVKNFLEEAKGKDLNIYINSGGGSVFAGMAIYNMIKRHKGQKNVYIDGLAGSIASVIALAGDNIYIPNNAYFMIHKPWCSTWGNANDLREQADILDKIEEGILNVYKDSLKDDVDIEVIRDMVNKETWLTGDEVAEYFNISVKESIDAVSCFSDCFSNYLNVPNILNKISNKESKNNTINNKKAKDDEQNNVNIESEKEKMMIELGL